MRNILDFIGNTPLILLDRIVQNPKVELYIKLEYFNPGGSIKSRVALQMILDAEKNGKLVPNSNQTILEPTGGNVGLGLAIIGAYRGYNVKLIIPDSCSKEKMAQIRSYGSEIIPADSNRGVHAHIDLLREIIRDHKDYIFLNQFKNKSNPKAHYCNTGYEIISSLKGIDYFISGIGSGGTITGIGERIKVKFPNCKVIAAQPEGCDVLKGKAIKHMIEGIAIGITPKVLNRRIVDGTCDVTESEAFKMVDDLARKEGIFVGPSTAVNVMAAIKISQKIKKKTTIVTVAPDSGNNYLSLYQRLKLFRTIP